MFDKRLKHKTAGVFPAQAVEKLSTAFIFIINFINSPR
ncbi:hypothetical protein KIS4809_3265 [Bacillus sp. ZZV12-4809]|nr:hypothetical protein KIS4809_3265 [Bacillus sp. ZZV12-4809]